MSGDEVAAFYRDLRPVVGALDDATDSEIEVDSTFSQRPAVCSSACDAITTVKVTPHPFVTITLPPGAVPVQPDAFVSYTQDGLAEPVHECSGVAQSAVPAARMWIAGSSPDRVRICVFGRICGRCWAGPARMCWWRPSTPVSPGAALRSGARCGGSTGLRSGSGTAVELASPIELASPTDRANDQLIVRSGRTGPSATVFMFGELLS
ncbi:hypothetical protein [Nocardia stercoris]|nr:hypothetical protein [Nocardia stercoris]